MAKKSTDDNLISEKLRAYGAEKPLGERKIVSTSEKGKTYRLYLPKLSQVRFIQLMATS